MCSQNETEPIGLKVNKHWKTTNNDKNERKKVSSEDCGEDSWVTKLK